MKHAPGMEDMGPPDEMSRDDDSDAKTPITEQGMPDDNGATISIPKEFVQGKQLKAGDTFMLKVVTTDDDGMEVAYMAEPAGKHMDRSAHDEIDTMAAEDTTDY